MMNPLTVAFMHRRNVSVHDTKILWLSLQSLWAAEKSTKVAVVQTLKDRQREGFVAISFVLLLGNLADEVQA